MSEQFVEILFPVQGVDLVASPYGGGKPSTSDSALNCRGQDPFKKRLRGGSRHGISKHVTEQIPNWQQGAPIQHLQAIVDPQAEALLVTFEEVQAELFPDLFLEDPSTNISLTNIRNTGRKVRRGGSGAQSNINIPKRTPTITWSDPADINQGTPLSGTQLNAIASDPFTGIAVAGTFVYSPDSGTILPVGENRNLNTTFTPTNTNQYRNNSKTVQIDVIDAGMEDTHVEVVGSINVIMGQTLTASGLSSADWGGFDDADAPVAGTITVDTPTLGTIPEFADVAAGIPYMVTFTPTDGVTYAGSTLWGTLNVILATWEADGIVASRAGTTIQATVDAITTSNLADPTTVANVGATVEALVGPDSPADNPPDGAGVFLYYDFELEVWYYEFSPS